MSQVGTIALMGAGGEPVDFWRTVNSQGLTSLPPMTIDEQRRTFTVTLRLPGGPRTVEVGEAPDGVRVTTAGPKLPRAAATHALDQIRHILRLDADLSGFYELAGRDPDLAWSVAGAGRMARSATVFEDLIKTVCTTNCAWSGTVRMVTALVAHLGEPAPDAPTEGWQGRAFPTPEAMAAVDEAFYREVASAGYRARYLKALAVAVAEGELDTESLATATPEELPEDELERRLLALPGVGPYAAAHMMMLLGRHSRLVLDSWTRPTYSKLVGLTDSARVPDAEIVARFTPYGPFAGLAFWLRITRDWVPDE